ncbi:IS1 family transposase [Cyanobacterium sp. Dongsha4]|uniref:IS1 family transposase n=1 Tax=Cyanobacterium sp. DS4 TaxID=2878255 RepID=UPI002E803C73|nr:IS1 family transposase [Cyanobacterium sp. Dongsha4]WVK99082.1 IS1 family transposase [Cyanobacterium sp. Dongsha4]WVK99126.1 IS1 family transposase [Cyanobacterium sp. Dongsha4]WVK99143.1 IS1 family transposase [Cyanobacterium sp. Dongsha4]WVK99266.1 IS1 family transposase [Cyanobacterium sp. Dongsha4]WVK99337.1 IS1 family transposase [Cyanobacterium sp. Dongsha4]
MSHQCPRCHNTKIIKNGFARGQQRFKCKHCNYQFTTDKIDRGKPMWMKLETAILYCSGMSMNSIAKLLNVSAQTILNWIRALALENYEKPEPCEAVVVELDELWHFIEFKKNKLWIWKAYDRNTNRLIDWELGKRDSETLKKLLIRLLKWDVTVYCTDDWKPYQELLSKHPDAYHVMTKSETIAIERNNSDNRHWFARFHRKTKVVSKSIEMVDLTMGLFAKFRVNGTIDSLINQRLTLLS